MNYQKENGQYKVDYTLFHQTEPIVMPEFSACDFTVMHGCRWNTIPTTSQTDTRYYGARTFNAPSRHRAYSVTGIDANSISRLTAPGGLFYQNQSHRRFNLGGRRLLSRFKRQRSSMKDKTTGSNGILGTPITKNMALAKTTPNAIEEEESVTCSIRCSTVN